MWSDSQLLLPIVRGTARLSAMMFALGTLGFALPKLASWRRLAFLLLCLSHATHYTFVVLHLRASRGPGLFASPQFLGMAIFGMLMYSLMVVLATAPDTPLQMHSSRRLMAESAAIYILGTAFTVAYVFRLRRAPMLAPSLLLLEVTSIAAFIRARYFTPPSARAASR